MNRKILLDDNSADFPKLLIRIKVCLILSARRRNQANYSSHHHRLGL